MNVLESLLILVATLSALWWAFARHRAPVALERLSLAGLGLGVLALALEGVLSRTEDRVSRLQGAGAESLSSRTPVPSLG